MTIAIGIAAISSITSSSFRFFFSDHKTRRFRIKTQIVSVYFKYECERAPEIQILYNRHIRHQTKRTYIFLNILSCNNRYGLRTQYNGLIRGQIKYMPVTIILQKGKKRIHPNYPLYYII